MTKKMSKKIKFSKKRVKFLSKHMHLKQSDIARLLNRTVDTVKGIYRTEMILPEHLELLAKYLNADFHYLTGEVSIEADPRSITEEKTIVDPDGYYVPEYVPKSQLVLESISNTAEIYKIVDFMFALYSFEESFAYINKKQDCLKEVFPEGNQSIIPEIYPITRDITNIVVEDLEKIGVLSDMLVDRIHDDISTTDRAPSRKSWIQKIMIYIILHYLGIDDSKKDELYKEYSEFFFEDLKKWQ